MNEKKDKTEYIELSQRKMKAMGIVVLGLVILAFAGGYFLGIYHTVEPFIIQAEHDSFADRVYVSLSALYDQDLSLSKNIHENNDLISTTSTEDLIVSNPESTQDHISIPDEKEQIDLLPEEPLYQPIPVQEKIEIDNDDKEVIDKKKKIDTLELVSLSKGDRWYARLIGYSHQKPAEIFAKKLADKGFNVVVTQRLGRSSTGQQKKWYQVVTTAYEDRNLLQKQVDKITSLEKLKGIQILTC